MVGNSEMLIYLGITQSDSGNQRAKSRQKSHKPHLSVTYLELKVYYFWLHGL